LTVLRRQLASALLAGRHSLKEHATDIPEQICITRDNVQVGVDGVVYLQVLDPEARILRTCYPRQLTRTRSILQAARQSRAPDWRLNAWKKRTGPEA
jgi:regulator of protease activity HflC (stomatin/prohibitin superfamily)